jgi:hypothetical protein
MSATLLWRLRKYTLVEQPLIQNMKKSILTISALLMFSTLFAQTLIPRVGLTLSNSSYAPVGFDTGDKASSSPLTGFTAGVGYEFTLAGIVSLQPEINFVQKGHKLEEISYPDGYEYIVKQEFKYNYLEIPVLAKVKFGGLTKFYVAAGPSVAIGLGGKYKIKSTFGGMTDVKYSSDIKFKDQPGDYEGQDVYVENKIDIGLQLGGGVILFNKVIVDVRYGLGLTDLNDDEDSKNNTLQFSVGVPLNLF